MGCRWGIAILGHTQSQFDAGGFEQRNIICRAEARRV
jgi:hypothetical protein